MLTIQDIAVIGAYKLRAKLSNGVEGVFDVSPYLHKGIFTQLQDVNYYICSSMTAVYFLIIP